MKRLIILIRHLPVRYLKWQNIKNGDGDGEWVGVFNKRIWILQQFEDHIAYRVIQQARVEQQSKKEHGDETEGSTGIEINGVKRAKKTRNGDTESDLGSMLSNYFRLDHDLMQYYDEWSERDSYFKKAAKQFYGIRILKQDVTENIFSFICSSNNNIARISSMVEKLSRFYGEKIGDYGGTVHFSFPPVKALAGDGVEQKLRESGFGYRAKYIAKAAQMIQQKGGDAWIQQLQNMNYEDAKKALMDLTGIGAKVADCICLMSLGHLEAIPVDTHIYQIARRLYLPYLPQQKTVTDKTYKLIGEHFRKLYGPLAGWAHTVLFCADLKKFQDEDS